jgi:hypothetical protein
LDKNAHYRISPGEWTAKQPFFGVIAPLYASLEEICGIDAPLSSFVQRPTFLKLMSYHPLGSVDKFGKHLNRHAIHTLASNDKAYINIIITEYPESARMEAEELFARPERLGDK